MTYLTVDPTLDPSRVDDSTPVSLKADRQGTLSISDRVRTAAIAGKLFVANWGSVSAALTGPATQADTPLRPSMWLNVPQGKTIYVVRQTVIVQSAGNTTQGEIAIAIASNNVGVGTSTAATQLQNANPSKISSTPGTTARANATANVDAAEDLVEIDRDSFVLSAVNQKFEYNANKNGLLIPIVGDAAFMTFIGGNAVVFFGQIVFIEEDSNLAS